MASKVSIRRLPRTSPLFLYSLLLLYSLNGVDAFTISRSPSFFRTTETSRDGRRCEHVLRSASSGSLGDAVRRRKILSPPKNSRSKRDDGNHFELDRFAGNIAFGYTTDLVTKLPDAPSPSSISRWLSDAQRVAFAVWDKDMIENVGRQTYKLKLMTIKFITITMAPEVDVLMWTESEKSKDDVFFIESVSFDPKLKLLPGINLSAKSLGIQIDVAGELRVSPDGKGLTGKIGFVTSGVLPPPLRVLPSRTLSSAAGLINRQIGDFAVRSFRTGARREYAKFRRTEEAEVKVADSS